MNLYNNLNLFKSGKNPVVTTGTFDGVHLGHRAIIRRLKESANKIKGETVIITFDPHPRVVLFPQDQSIKLIITREEKIELLEKAGIDHLIIHPFTKEFASLSSDEFIEKILVKQIGTKRLVIGYDHHFGKNREGSFEKLKEKGIEFGFEVEEIPAQEIDHISVSSTKIRHAIETGDIETANSYLGYHFMINGKVKPGNKLGRTIGFPTANILIDDPFKIIPGRGVYAVRILYNNTYYNGILNIGFRPTIGGKDLVIEVHILDFNEEIYDRYLRVEFISRIRDEQRFDDLDALKAQILRDRDTAVRIFDSKI